MRERSRRTCLPAKNTGCYVCSFLVGAGKKQEQDLLACETTRDVMFVGF